MLIFYFANSFINGNYLNKLIAVSFNTISIISGTGFISENFENWELCLCFFLILMFIGGCAGSTTGG